MIIYKLKWLSLEMALERGDKMELPAEHGREGNDLGTSQKDTQCELRNYSAH